MATGRGLTELGSAAGGGKTQPPCTRESRHRGEGAAAAPSRLATCEHPRERGWRMSSALPLSAGKQQHLDGSNAAACCFRSSLESQSRGFQKQPRLKHLPCIRRGAKPCGAAPDAGWPLQLRSPFPFGGESGDGEGVQTICGTSGPWTP